MFFGFPVNQVIQVIRVIQLIQDNQDKQSNQDNQNNQNNQDNQYNQDNQNPMVGAILHPRNILKMKEFHLHHRCIVIFNLKGIAPRGPMAPSLEVRGAPLL